MAHIKSRKHSDARISTSQAAAMSLALASLSVYAAEPAPVPAAPTEGTLPAVSVKAKRENEYKAEKASSPKFVKPLLDTPQTITVIKKEVLQDQGAVSLSEALRNVPGITFTLGENGNTTTGDSIFMRGFDTSGSIFIDGIRDLGTITRDVFNIEQVEVVKGPSGSDNGRGSPTGYINMSSKAPTLENFNNGSATVGSANRVRLTADLNRNFDVGLPGTALRVNVMTDQGDKVGRDVAENKRFGIAPSLAFGLGTPTRATVSYLHMEQDNIPDGGIPAIGFPGNNYSYATTSTVPLTTQNQVKALVAGAPKVNSRNYYGSLNDFDKVKADVFTIKFEHDLAPRTTIRNIARWGRTTQRYELTGIGALGNLENGTGPAATANTNLATWTASRSRQGKNQRNEILTNQTSLSAEFNTGAVKHSLTTGLEFIHENQKTLGFTTSGTTTAANLYNPSTSNSFASIVPSGAYTDGATTTVAAYAFDTLEVTNQWLFNVGLRVDRYRTTTSGRTVVTGGTNGNSASYPGVTVGSLGSDAASDSGTLKTWKLGTVYKPVPTGSIYAAVATSQKPPGSDNFSLNANSNTNINNPNLDPQEATTYEVGTKWDLMDNRLVLTAAAYDTTNKNDLAVVDTAGTVQQYGKKKVRGLEFAASGQVTTALQLTAGVAFMDTKVAQGTSTQTGSELNFSPKMTFTSWATYKLPLGFTVGGGARYVDSQTTSVSNTQATVSSLPQIPSYWVFDGLVGYEFSKNIAVQLNVTNLADKQYLASVNSGRNRYTLGAPRTLALTANFKY